MLAAALAVLIVAWAVANLVFGQAAVALISPDTDAGMRAISMFDKLFGALVLFLLAADVGRRRLRWVAAGFLVLGLGRHAVFDPLQTLLGVAPDLNTQAYGKLVIWTAALTLFVVGLLPDNPPRLSWQRGLAILAGFVALSAATLAAMNLLPLLIEGASPWDADDVLGYGLLSGLTGWHFAFFMLPLGLSVAAAAGTIRRDRGKTVGGWLRCPARLEVRGNRRCAGRARRGLGHGRRHERRPRPPVREPAMARPRVRRRGPRDPGRHLGRGDHHRGRRAGRGRRRLGPERHWVVGRTGGQPFVPRALRLHYLR